MRAATLKNVDGMKREREKQRKISLAWNPRNCSKKGKKTFPSEKIIKRGI